MLAQRFLVLATICAGLKPSEHVTLPDFCSLADFKFAPHDGAGTGTLLPGAVADCDGVEMEAISAKGLAASFESPRFAVRGGRRYRASFSVQTEQLVAVPGGPGQGAATLTGGVYLHFFDANGDSGAWNPQYGTLAPADTDQSWQEFATEFVVPTTGVTAVFHLAFGAHTDSYSPDRMHGGRATGKCSIANVSLSDIAAAPPLAATIRVADPTLQAAIDQSFDCLHNSKQSGNFTVGAGYTISGNISPDLTFGLHGIRRTGHAAYVEAIQKQWEWHAPEETGEYDAGRVMGQINWPLGVDNLFSFTGDLEYLEAKLPLVDASLEYVHQHEDSDGLVTLIPKGKGHVGGGADWVDWYESRLDGRTFQFQMWYIRTLRRFSEIHAEFASSFGKATLAQVYSRRAEALLQTLQKTLWAGDHWVTNPDYADEGEWLDDTIWSIYHGITSPEREAQLWAKIDKNSSFFESVPTRWGAFPTHHWDCSWFGRLGAGDIMARYKAGQHHRAQSLLNRIASIIADQGNIYEGYDMNGCGLASCGCTTSGYGDYLEHCGGLIWAVTEGPFGVDFDSAGHDNGNWAATVQPRFPADWPEASMTTQLRGRPLTVEWTRSSGVSSGTLTLTQTGADVLRVRVLGCDVVPKSGVVELQPSQPMSFVCASSAGQMEMV